MPSGIGLHSIPLGVKSRSTALLGDAEGGTARFHLYRDGIVSSRLSCARHQPRDRRGNEGTRWRAAVMPLLPAVYPVSSPTIGRLPILPPSAISEEATDVGIQHPVHPLPLNAHRQRIRRSILRSATRCSMNFIVHAWLRLSVCRLWQQRPSEPASRG